MNGDVICAECRQPVSRENTIPHGDTFVCAACKPTFIQRLREGAAMPAGELPYAGFWVRCWATIIDTLLIEIVKLPILAGNKPRPAKCSSD